MSTKNQDQEVIEILDNAIQFDLQCYNLGTNKKLTVYDLAKKTYTNIIELKLQNCQLHSLPQFKMPNLKKLYCEENQISSLQQFAKGIYPSLQIINLDYNSVRAIPLLKTDKLTEISCECNGLSSVDQFVKGTYPEFKRLNIPRNGFKNLVNLSLQMPKLNILSLWANKIQNLEHFSQGTYQQLEIISFYDNKIKRIPQLKMQKLKFFEFRYNKIETISQFAQGFYPQLQNVDFSNNKIKAISQLKTRKLKDLSYNNNQIQSIKGLFYNSLLKQLNPVGNTQYLQRLYLENNNIKNIQELCFNQFNNLRVLSLTKNWITNLQHLNKCKFPSSLQYFYLSENKYYSFDISKMKASNIIDLKLQRQKDQKDLSIITVCKLQTSNLQSTIMFTNKNEKILQLKAAASLRRKFVNSKVQIVQSKK